MSVINTNYLALVSQSNLVKSQNQLGQAIERLSSGLRINSAKDDAAGQAIANRFTANIRGLTQATRNANDGISIAQTTEGALNEINDNLLRIRELTVQAANGSNSDSDRDSIQAEIGQRLDEIDRVSRESKFNGTTILGAATTGLTVQVGANDGETISIDLREISSTSLNLGGFNVNDVGITPHKAATLDDLTAAGATEIVAGKHYQLSTGNNQVTAAEAFGSASGVLTVNGPADDNAWAVALGWGGATPEVTLTGLTGDGEGNYTFDVTDVTDANVGTRITATSSANPVLATYTTNIGTPQDIKIDNTGAITDRNGNTLYLTVDGELSLQNIGAGTVAATAGGLGAAISKASATLSIEGGITYTGNGNANEITASGAQVTAGQLATISTTNPGWTFSYGSSVGGTNAAITVSDNDGVQVAGSNLYSDGDGAYTLATSTITDLYVHTNGNVTGADAAQYFVDTNGVLTTESQTQGPRTTNPLALLDNALADVDSLRSELGAVQNRFESTIANLTNTVNNLSAARSRIEDADYAVEVSNMTRAQILQQAGTSVLAQANQIPQTVLSLLR